MVGKYTTYDPERVLSDRAEQVHSKVDKLTKYATSDPDGWGECLKYMQMNKSASADNAWCFESQTLPSCAEWIKNTAKRTNEGGAVEFNNVNSGDEWLEMSPDGVSADIMHKSATARLRTYTSAIKDIEEAEMTLRQVADDAAVAMQEKLAAFKVKIVGNNDVWRSCIMDAADIMTADDFTKAASIMETYFAKARVHGLEKVANINRGYSVRLAKDSTGLVEDLQELVDLQAAKEKALDLLDGFQVKSASVRLENILNSVVANPTFMPSKTVKTQKYDESLDKGLQEIALQKLMLTDPIIAEADQATVQDLYTTIADLSPTVAKDPIRLAPVLKEALQYDALPMQQIKDLLSIEESSTKIKKYNKDVKDKESKE
jgi:hypothetical protein